MTSRQLAVFALLAAIGGASFLFIRVAAPMLGPFMLIVASVLIAAAAVAAIFEVRKKNPIIERPQTTLATEWRVWIGPREPIEDEVVASVPLRGDRVVREVSDESRRRSVA